MMARQAQEREVLGALLDEAQPSRTGPSGTTAGNQEQATTSIALIKGLHSLIFLGMAAAIFHTLYSGITNRISRLTAVSIASVIGEGAVLLANNGRCPLTDIVEDLGAEHGSVSDIFLPRWFANRIPVLFTPPFAVGLVAVGVRRRHRQPALAVILTITGGLFLAIPWLLRLDHPRTRKGA